MKKFNQKVLSVSVSTALTLAICSVIPMSLASDISIYSDSKKGKTGILLMLDTSGSMGISSLVLPKNNKFGSPGDVEETQCQLKSVSEAGGNMAGIIDEYQYNAVDNRTTVTKNGQKVNNAVTNGLTKGKTSFYKEVQINGTIVPYYVRGCGTATVDETTGKLIETENNRFDRLSHLKDAILTLLADTNKLDNEIQLGVGYFSSNTNLYVGKKDSTREIPFVDGHSGTILLPVQKLTPEHRLALAQEIAKFVSIDTQTKQDGTSATDQTYSSTKPPKNPKASSGTPTAHAYAEAGAYMMGTQTKTVSHTGNEVKFIYDGTAFIRNDASGANPRQVYYVCVAVGNDVSGGLGYTGNVKQCINAWPESNSFSNGKLVDAVKKNIKIPFNSSWLDLTATNLTGDQKQAVENARAQLDALNFSTAWDAYTKLPSGWRYGGWMKVDHQPMDIEPVAGLAWHSYVVNNTQYFRNLVSYRVSPFTLNGTDDNYAGGFSYSAAATKNGAKYSAGGSTNSCDGNGIYFLTDGAPNSTKDEMARSIMNDTLATSLSNTSTYQFPTSVRLTELTDSTLLKSPKMQSQLFANETGGWEYIGAYAKKLKDATQNPGGMAIKTAVVGFGSSFAGIPKKVDGTYNCEAVRSTNLDAYNACMWGQSDFGEGGFYFAENADDISRSIIEFVKQVEVKIDPVVTGNPTVPVDALNPTELQNHAYYASFQPTVSTSNQLWVGNLNKYQVLNGELYSANGVARLITDNGSLNPAANGYWIGGALGQLEIGANFETDGSTITKRKVYTNRVMSGNVASASNELKLVDVNALFGGDFSSDADKNYWLNVLGFDVASSDTGITKANLNNYAQDKRLGAVMHSTPVMLTQEGKISVDKTKGLTTTERKDYLMYGSTQGILHILDVATGKEVFSFLPHEMMVNQKAALLLKDQTAAGSANLFYGIDAPWVAHTQYTTKANGLLTVSDSDRTVNGKDEDVLKGHQWVYGGLRMGGKSYYALDLSNINQPTMKFHIDPTAATSSQPLKRMGQSWSKPTLGYVNWAGKKKLVMFVGGGYDNEGSGICASDSTLNNKGYECPTYKQTNKIGAGVYMFDAQNGDLLWWTSVDDNSTPAGSEIRFTQNDDLKYSVVGQINAVDRNSDGLIDHLYFGDLAGQAFRVDLNNALNVSSTLPEKEAKDGFGTRTVTLFTEHVDTGLSPRFYEMPSFSVHRDTADTGKIFAVATFSSGNRSTPLADSAQSANDGVFTFYDNDVTSPDLYASNYTLKSTKMKRLQTLDLNSGVARMVNDQYTAGWKHTFSSTAGVYKGMNDIYALDGMLYVNVYHKDGVGISGSCGGGVKGDSYLYQYCLPYGKCDFYPTGTVGVNRVKLGAGILGTGVGQGYNGKINTLGLIVNRDDPNPNDCKKEANKNLPQCQLFDNAVKLQQLRWYESR